MSRSDSPAVPWNTCCSGFNACKSICDYTVHYRAYAGHCGMFSWGSRSWNFKTERYVWLFEWFYLTTVIYYLHKIMCLWSNLFSEGGTVALWNICSIDQCRPNYIYYRLLNTVFPGQALERKKLTLKATCGSGDHSVRLVEDRKHDRFAKHLIRGQ